MVPTVKTQTTTPKRPPNRLTEKQVRDLQAYAQARGMVLTIRTRVTPP